MAVYTGSAGTNATYKVDTETGLCEITGTGAMSDVGYYTSSPIYQYRTNITKVIVHEGITRIGKQWFYCNKCTSFEIAGSVSASGDNAIRYGAKGAIVTFGSESNPTQMSTIAQGVMTYINSGVLVVYAQKKIQFGGTGASTGDTGVLYAVPSKGYKFVKWVRGSTEYTTNPVNLEQGGILNYTYEPIFESLPKYALSVKASPTAGGSVTGGGTYESGTTVTLKATQNTGYKFKQWSDGNTNATRTVTVTGNATYTAQFEKVTVTISANASPSEGGTITGAGTYAYGDSYTLAAVPNEGYKFVRWSTWDTSQTITRTASLSDEEFTAYFELDKINKIYVGTQQPKEIYVGTTLIKAIYVGTTKVYG